MDADAAGRPAGTPIGLTVVVVATVARCVAILAAFYGDLGSRGLDWLAQHAPIVLAPSGTPIGLIGRVLLLAMLVASVLAIWGLLTRKEWGWTISIIAAGTILALNLGAWALDDRHPVSMLANTIIVFYLNQRDVRQAFRVAAG